jgi:hypothetical protein
LGFFPRGMVFAEFFCAAAENTKMIKRKRRGEF